MQNKILCICTLLTIPVVAMEKDSKSPLKLTHRSPEITRIHTPEYLQYHEQKRDLKYDLKMVNAALKATNDVIQAKKESSLQPHYSLSIIPEHYNFAGNVLPREFADTYAIIPIAVAHALKSNVFKRILIIDEILTREPEVNDDDDDDDDKKDDYDYIKMYYSQKNGSLFDLNKDESNALFNLSEVDDDTDEILTREPEVDDDDENDDYDYMNMKMYYSQGNGSLFYPDKDSELFNLFDGKIITYDKIEQNIDTFLETDGKDIDLIFYTPDLDQDAFNSHTYISILQKHIPTVFILADCPEEKEQSTIAHISNSILNQSKLPLYTFDVHYVGYTENYIVKNESSSTDTFEENRLTYQSPEINRIHTQEYWEWVTNNHDYPELEAGLTWVAQAIDATNDIIKAKQNNHTNFNYSICIIPDSFYAAGNKVPPQFGDLYAIIPIAAAHALQSDLFEKILIIDEHLKPGKNDHYYTFREYCSQENGSIFYPATKNTSFNIFNQKIFIKYADSILDYNYYESLRSEQFHNLCKQLGMEFHRELFHTDFNNPNINLAFYNIDEDMQDLTERIETITTLLEKNIPIVFICTCQSIADDIQSIIEKQTKKLDEKGIVCKNKFYM